MVKASKKRLILNSKKRTSSKAEYRGVYHGAHELSESSSSESNESNDDRFDKEQPKYKVNNMK